MQACAQLFYKLVDRKGVSWGETDLWLEIKKLVLGNQLCAAQEFHHLVSYGQENQDPEQSTNIYIIKKC